MSAALRADARHEQRHVADERPYRSQFGRVGRSDDEPELAATIPVAAGQPRHTLIQRLAADVEHLQIGAAGIAGPAQQKGAAVGVGKKWLDRIATHVGRERHGVGTVTLEGLACVVFRGRADIAALDVEDHRDVGMPFVQVRQQPFELRLGARRGEIRELRLEGADEVGGRVDDLAAEGVDRVWRITQRRGQTRRIGIESDAEQRPGLLPASREPIDEACPSTQVKTPARILRKDAGQPWRRALTSHRRARPQRSRRSEVSASSISSRVASAEVSSAAASPGADVRSASHQRVAPAAPASSSQRNARIRSRRAATLATAGSSHD